MSSLYHQSNIPYLSDILFITNCIKPASSLRTFLHLTLPLSCPESVSVNYDNGVTFRGENVSLENISYETIHSMVSSMKRNNDVFFNVKDFKLPLIKATHSGSSLFFFGSDLVYGLPLIYSKSTLFRQDIEAISLIIHSCFRKKNPLKLLEQQLNYYNLGYELKNNALELKY